MIQLPDFEKAWDYENGFHLTCDISRISKILAQWELFRMVQDVPGDIVECGVFKGASLARFAAFRQLLGNPFSKKIIGFDIFGKYPETSFTDDKPFRQRFVQGAGEQSISVEQLMTVLEHKKCEQNVELVAGNICDTVPRYVELSVKNFTAQPGHRHLRTRGNDSRISVPAHREGWYFDYR